MGQTQSDVTHSERNITATIKSKNVTKNVHFYSIGISQNQKVIVKRNVMLLKIQMKKVMRVNLKKNILVNLLYMTKVLKDFKVRVDSLLEPLFI